MKNKTKNKIHQIAAVVSTLCIATFFISTILVELFGEYNSIAMIKSLIVIPGLFILIPAIAITGATGFAFAKKMKSPIVEQKKKRIPFIAGNGIIILVPSAIFLDQWASTGAFNTSFYILQSVELIAGAANLTLMGMSIRDGLKLSGKI